MKDDGLNYRIVKGRMVGPEKKGEYTMTTPTTTPTREPLTADEIGAYLFYVEKLGTDYDKEMVWRLKVTIDALAARLAEAQTMLQEQYGYVERLERLLTKCANRRDAAEVAAASARETAVRIVEELYLNSGGSVLDADTLDAVIAALKHSAQPAPAEADDLGMLEKGLRILREHGSVVFSHGCEPRPLPAPPTAREGE